MVTKHSEHNHKIGDELKLFKPDLLKYFLKYMITYV